MMKEEMWRHLPKTKLPGCYDRLIKFISRFNEPVGSAHADWKEARTNHDGVQAPGIDIMGESASRNVAGFSKSSESAYGRKIGLSRPL
jgi:hypothetical protein